ncbi:MAG TPA: CHAT domain-containing protein [Solirubrobacterales bacterium]|nr:CHAT domain-containing protein [Solirubrobacterales bacterium]
MRHLTLEITDFQDDAHWAWRLLDEAGNFVADQDVSLDRSAAEYRGYLDLHGYVRWNASPVSPIADEVTTVRRVAKWVRAQAWGRVGDEILAAAQLEPVTVHVKTPPTAKVLLFRPFELGLVLDDGPGGLDVSLVFDVGEDSGARPEPGTTDLLRMLAIFSMPTDKAALDVRRERHELRRLVKRIGETTGGAIELRILQYGVTRGLLEEALEEGEGWDLVHFSGHGLPSGLLLEKEDGTADLVHSSEFAELLWPTRGRLELVTLSSCESGATTAAHTMRLLGVAPPKSLEPADSEDPGDPLPAVAQRISSQIGCASLAMRYPVADDFAVGLAVNLYGGMLETGQTLPRALQRALRKEVGANGKPEEVALSLATPALFGSRALDLKLVPPQGDPPSFDLAAMKLAYFEPEPETFVGRVGPLATASAALAPKSAYRAIVFHGMAGAGKTACALELAYRHEDRRFGAMAWYRAPSEGNDIGSALAQFAVALEAQLPGLELAHVVDDATKLTAHLPRLRTMLASRSVLVVLDNVESLLTSAGAWRDERWRLLMDAFVGHDGLSRLVLTSRTTPLPMRDDERVLVQPIHSLSAKESVLLASRMPNLGRLMAGDGNFDPQEGRELVRRVLEMVQGNPKLMELADRQAVDAEALRERLSEADEVWGDRVSLDGFFVTGEAPNEVRAEDFLQVIERWTGGIASNLSEDERFAFQLICCLETSDRVSAAIALAWKELNSIRHERDAPELMPILRSLAGHGLVDLETRGEHWQVSVHPAVEQAEKDAVDEELSAEIDRVMAAVWMTVHRFASERQDTVSVVRSGLAAAPYLLRQGKAVTAAVHLGIAVTRDSSAQTLAKALPYLRQAVAQTAGTDDELVPRGVMLKARAASGPSDVSGEMWELLDVLKEKEDYVNACALLTDLFGVLFRASRLKEAQEVAEAIPEITGLAEFGPWTRLGDRCVQLRVMQAKGENRQVLDEVEPLIEKMESLPLDGDQKEAAQPWNVREALLGVAASAAGALREWEKMLELHERIRQSEIERDAPVVEQTRTALNAVGPLIELERYEEAEKALRSLRTTFESLGDHRSLPEVFNSLAVLEAKRGHVDDAVELGRKALRLLYVNREPQGIAGGHNNFALHLRQARRGPDEVIAHQLAAALISFQTEAGEFTRIAGVLALLLKETGPDALPESFSSLCERVERVEGVDFQAFFLGLPGGTPDGDEAIAAVLRRLPRLEDS